MNAFFSFDLFMVYINISECKQHLYRYEILHTLNLGCNFMTLRESARINGLDVMLDGFMLQIMYTSFPS